VSTQADEEMHFDRSVSEPLLRMLSDDAGAALVERACGQDHEPLFDVQLRSAPKGTASWATLYYGMTALLNLRERRGEFQLTAHRKYMALDTFDERWTDWQPQESIELAWPKVERYLDDIIDHVGDTPALRKEGPVHAAIASGNSDAYRVIQREARPSFTDTQTRQRRLDGWAAPFNRALEEHDPGERWWPSDVKVGSSLDFLAVDIGGRLALIEAKADTASAAAIAKVAVQAGVYAAMFADLLQERPRETVEAIERMLTQRAALGLSRPGVLHLREAGGVVPVVAIGPGRPSPEVRRRMWQVARAVADAADHRIDPMEVWYLDRVGRIAEVERWEDIAQMEQHR
jgi:hypothetical protein